MVVKDVLKPVRKDITSYTVKYIIFWLMDNTPQALILERLLFYLPDKELGELKNAIVMETLAACGLNGDQKQTWVATITEMMNEGPKFIFGLPKIRQAVISQ
ncbi:hypothetical protein DPMN_038889 [Dreissena polymorpha]|uniref:Uncharacterized protein n=1 Tax=Dreissena polymorpha TaxID=45954 RepID=A0A9D4MFI1_DREPO|nr:hypothetical protein DPMN_038889 [Dreissena polymorpha]